MDAALLLVHFAVKVLFLAMPLGVAWLAFRRLALSRSTNAWIYAATGMFAAFTAAGLVPWALGLGGAGWAFFLFAALCPPLWVFVVVVCGPGRNTAYDLARQAAVGASAPAPQDPPGRLPPLVLENPDWPDTRVPVFRHHARRAGQGDAAADRRAGAAPRSLLAVARDMRGNASAGHRRRPRLLAPPAASEKLTDLPFLPQG